MAAAPPATPRSPRRLDASRYPIAYALVVGTSFIGIWWLLDPLWTRVGGTGGLSRPHMIFVGGVYASAMTLMARRRAAVSEPVA